MNPRRVAAVIAAVAALVAFDRVSVALSGWGPSHLLRPPAAIILDTPLVSAQRDSSVQAVQGWTNGNQPAGAGLAGQQTVAWCLYGDNNWKSQDGYRLRCMVTERSYFGWSGDFGVVRDGILRELAQDCVAELRPTIGTPVSTLDIDGGIFRCAGEVEVRLTFRTTSGLTVDDDVIQPLDNCTGDQRCLQLTSTTEIQRALIASDWFVAISASHVFFEDQP
jgi:hypothetical protein